MRGKRFRLWRPRPPAWMGGGFGTKSQRRCAALLVALSIDYAVLFAPPNLTGTDDASMLAAFELDEFGQYKVLWRMTLGGDANRSGLSRFVCYDHYYYGFPFFLVSALVFWPLKVAYTLRPRRASPG